MMLTLILSMMLLPLVIGLATSVPKALAPRWYDTSTATWSILQNVMQTGDARSLVHMHDLGRREVVEARAAGGAVGPHVLGVHEFAKIHIGQLLGQTDGVEGVAGGAKDGAELRGAFPEAFQVVLAVVEDYAAVGVIDAVIEVVAELAAMDGLAGDLGHGGRGGGDQVLRRPRAGV